jgi:hypothetical protein|tara:strand:- start:655 stop:912 length:258 start_codon:yes stop_codon:yes gene_type:complete
MPNETKYARELKAAVNRPSHYTQNGTETIEMIRQSLTDEEFSGYLKGNILKYVCRYKYKGMPLKDLMKAQWYLERLVREQRENDK